MHADAYRGPMAGLPDPERDRQFYEGVPARRLVAWFVDVALVLLVGVPLALLFGLFTLGFGFALFPLVVAGTGFLYRVATIAGGSATWGMRFVGIELRRGDGSRFDLIDRDPAHRHLHGLHRHDRAAGDQLPDHRRDPLPPEPRRHRPRHHGDQRAGRLSALAAGVYPPGENPVAPLRILLLPFGAKGECHPGPHMRHSLPQSHQFYVTAPQPCPYLAGKVERKLFTALQGEGAVQLNDVLSHQGFRGARRTCSTARPAPAARPACRHASSCATSAPRASQRRVMHRNADLERVPRSPWATQAQYALFRRYLDARHATGGGITKQRALFQASPSSEIARQASEGRRWLRLDRRLEGRGRNRLVAAERYGFHLERRRAARRRLRERASGDDGTEAESEQRRECRVATSRR